MDVIELQLMQWILPRFFINSSVQFTFFTHALRGGFTLGDVMRSDVFSFKVIQKNLRFARMGGKSLSWNVITLKMFILKKISLYQAQKADSTFYLLWPHLLLSQYTFKKIRELKQGQGRSIHVWVGESFKGFQ